MDLYPRFRSFRRKLSPEAFAGRFRRKFQGLINLQVEDKIDATMESMLATSREKETIEHRTASPPSIKKQRKDKKNARTKKILIAGQAKRILAFE
jgi:hypothetical protein